MSDNSAQPMTTKELREAYELFGKEQLIGFLIEKTLEIRMLRRENQELKLQD